MAPICLASTALSSLMLLPIHRRQNASVSSYPSPDYKGIIENIYSAQRAEHRETIERVCADYLNGNSNISTINKVASGLPDCLKSEGSIAR